MEQYQGSDGRIVPEQSASRLLADGEDVAVAANDVSGVLEIDLVQWHIAARPSDIAKLPDGRARQRLEKQEHGKASVRAKVEHPFRVIKRQFGLTKVRFRGLAKNTAHVVTLFALSNPWMARKKLMAGGSNPSANDMRQEMRDANSLNRSNASAIRYISAA
jgi:IS5 family transposase